jgi:hypothetical protein
VEPRLLVCLVEAGHVAAVRHLDERYEKRRQAVGDTSGALTGCYQPDYLARLREDWPA